MTNKEAIEILNPMFEQCKGTNYFSKNEETALDLAIKALEERPQGEWNYFAEEMDGIRMTGECPNCKQRRIIDNFCSNCGADMRGNSNGRL